MAAADYDCVNVLLRFRSHVSSMTPSQWNPARGIYINAAAQKIELKSTLVSDKVS